MAVFTTTVRGIAAGCGLKMEPSVLCFAHFLHSHKARSANKKTKCGQQQTKHSEKRILSPMGDSEEAVGTDHIYTGDFFPSLERTQLRTDNILI
jgi:hypothetical protein